MDAFFATIFFLTGTACTIGGIVMLWRRLPVLLSGQKVTGTIESWERRRDAEAPSSFFYFPHVRFRDETGKLRVVRVDRGYNSEKYAVGEPYPIRFDRENPTRAYAGRPFDMLSGAVVMLILGISGLWVAVMLAA